MLMKQILERAEIHFWNIFVQVVDDSAILQKSIDKAVGFMDNEKVNGFLAQLMVICVIALIAGFFGAVILGLG